VSAAQELADFRLNMTNVNSYAASSLFRGRHRGDGPDRAGNSNQSLTAGGDKCGLGRVVHGGASTSDILTSGACGRWSSVYSGPTMLVLTLENDGYHGMTGKRRCRAWGAGATGG